MHDEALMRRALTEAKRAAGNTSPNPLVGAVIATRHGDPIAAGRHERAGAPHAEAVALSRAGEAARGATLFVTLEPCNHLGRTPPCTQAIIDAGIERVVAAVSDADPGVEGGGIERLRAAGISVDVGVLEEEARRLNRQYFKQRTTGMPFVTLKMAQTIDGAIGESAELRTQLTGAPAARHVRSLRYEHDAVMIGVRTAIVDDPLLTVRPHRARAVPYLRIVVDPTARLPLDRRLLQDQSRARTIVATTAAAPAERLQAFAERGVETLTCGADARGGVDMRDLLARLGARGVLGVLCEGGPTLAAALLDAGLVDELQLIIAPVALGTHDAARAFASLGAPLLVEVEQAHQLGDDTLVVATPRRRDSTASPE